MPPTITACQTDSYHSEILQGTHSSSDTYKMALISASGTGTYAKSFTNVGTPGSGAPSTSNLGTDECTGAGYTSGGATLTGFSVTIDGVNDVAMLTFNTPVQWTSATLSAAGAIIYNSSKSNKAVAILSFGGTITSTNGTFQVSLPAVAYNTALIRLS
jgi:hypothetical protein